jgi:SAM-dependent methyltransferase
MSERAKYLRSNRELWDAWTGIHRDSAFYDIDAFLSGESSLNGIEREAVGDVRGKRLLHLQCHFGMDTLSWARLGAEVTGVDFSPKAIEAARELAAQAGIEAEFLCADVTQLPAEWSGRFDIVFTSYGVLPWLPDLSPWAATIARVLRPGGVLHLVDFHPLTGMLDDDGRTLRHPYFHASEPDRYEVEGSYADPGADFRHEAFEWAHGLSDVLMSLIRAGLSIRELHEYDYSPHGCYPYLEEQEPGRWRVRGATERLPLVFRVLASRSGEPGVTTPF